MNKEGVVPLFIEANNEEFVNGRQTQNRNVAERDREYKLQVRRPSICQSWVGVDTIPTHTRTGAELRWRYDGVHETVQKNRLTFVVTR